MPNNILFFKKKILYQLKTSIEERNEIEKMLQDQSLLTQTEINTQHILHSRLCKYIDNLENALLRIENGTFGICEELGDIINYDRLSEVPHSQYSYKYKKDVYKGEVKINEDDKNRDQILDFDDNSTDYEG